MTQKIMTIFATDLSAIRKKAEQSALNIEQIKDNLDSERQELRQLVEEYNIKRVELLKEELRVRRMTWCTHCSKVLSESETDLVFIEGREKYSHGYENSYYGFRDFSKLHRTCLGCREEFSDKHGNHGAYTQTKDQSSFFAFRVAKREDGYYTRKFGNWIKIEDEKCALSSPPSELVERLAKEWNLPPRMEVKFQNDELVIHEQVSAPVHEQVTATKVA